LTNTKSGVADKRSRQVNKDDLSDETQEETSVRKRASDLGKLRLGTDRFYAPKLHSGVIERPSIMHRLLAAPPGSTIVLQGPAGHGKTTLMQQLNARHHEAGVLTGWLTFEDADNDARRCFELLEDFFAHLEARAGFVPGHASGDEPTSRSERFAQRLMALTDAVPGVSIFLDEFQTLAESSIHAFFRDLIARLHGRVHVVIGSRTVPKLGLSRLVVTGDAMLVRADGLRFSRGELGELFQDGSLSDLDETQIDSVFRSTDGWPAAVQLYRLAARSQTVRAGLSDPEVAGQPQQLTDYLADNVLSLQERELQTFLLQTSVLNRLSPDLCNHITGRGDAREVLLDLEQAGLFLRSLDSYGQWYKYHTVFADFLRAHIGRTNPEAVRRVHRQAADWFETHELPEYALDHLVALGDHERAARVLDRWAAQLIPKGHLATVARWLDRIPDEVILADPALTVKMGWVVTFLRRQAQLPPVLWTIERNCRREVPESRHGSHVVASMIYILQDDLERSEQAASRAIVDEMAASSFESFECGAAANVLAFAALCRGDFESAHDYLVQARAHGEMSGTVFSWGYSLALIGADALVRGRVNDALNQMRQGAEDKRLEEDGSMASAALSAVMMDALYEANELDQLATCYEHFRDVQDAALPDFLMAAQFARVRSLDAIGEHAQGDALLDQLATLAYAGGWRRLIRIIGWERVRRELIAGRLEHAHKIASRIPPATPTQSTEVMRFNEDINDEVIGRIRLALHDGRGRDALERVRQALPVAEASGRVRRQIRLMILNALALHCDHDRDEAQAELTRALELGHAGGFVRAFLDEGQALAKLLSATVKQEAPHWPDALRDYARDLLKHLKHARLQGSLAIQPARELIDPLTEREEEIVALVAAGASNKAAAGKLFVSENTIKFHLKNIYSKLGASSRIQAVQIAREMHLIE